MKLDAPKAEVPAEPITEPADEAGFGGSSSEEPSMDSGEELPVDDKPFDDEPFDAGVEADEDSDPKKYIEQLTGKLGQSLRQYSEDQGQPDYELEKFAINSLLSATHTSQMDEEDKNDIIKKVNTSGNEDNSEDSDNTEANGNDNNGDNNDNSGFDDSSNSGENNGEEDLQEGEYLLDKEEVPKVSIFAPKGSKEHNPENDLDEADDSDPCWKNYKQVGMKDKGGKQVPNCVPVNEGIEGRESNNYTFWQNLKTLNHASSELLGMDKDKIDDMCANGHAWAVDHISTSADDIEEVYHFFDTNVDSSSMDYDGETESGYEDEYGTVESVELYEGKYDDKKLNKPTSGDVKKFKVFVKNKKGNVIKVNFGDPNMEIKRDDPKRKKAFRARHKCSTAKDKTTPKYWSCKMWSSTPVSKIVAENLIVNDENSTFGKKYLAMRLRETFNDDLEPAVEPAPTPVIEPKRTTKPLVPSRKNKPFTIEPDTIPQTDPKAEK